MGSHLAKALAFFLNNAAYLFKLPLYLGGAAGSGCVLVSGLLISGPLTIKRKKGGGKGGNWTKSFKK